MGFKIIYEPTGKAFEYASLALNHYTGCSFSCNYCFAPLVLKRDKEQFHREVKERNRVLELVEKDCQLDLFDGRAVLLSFTCDPYQDIDEELQLTREVLKLFKKYNVNFKILTKGGMRAARDFDLYKPGDSFGSTLTFVSRKLSEEFEPNAAPPHQRLAALSRAHSMGIKTWVSLEPVINPEETLEIINITAGYVDLYKVGTINYSELKKKINWKRFGEKAISLLQGYGKEFYIKEDLKVFLK